MRNSQHVQWMFKSSVTAQVIVQFFVKVPSRTTRSTKRNNGTANPPHPKRQHLDNSCEQDDDSSSRDIEDFVDET